MKMFKIEVLRIISFVYFLGATVETAVMWTSHIKDSDNHNPELEFRTNHAYAIISYVNLAVLLLYLLLAVIVDFLAQRHKSKDMHENLQKLVNIRSVLFVSAALPLAVITSIMYCTLYLYNRDLIAPAQIMDILSITSQINCHILNLLPIFFELLYGNHSLPVYIQGIGCCTVGYFVVLIGTVIPYLRTGKWIYALLDHMNVFEKISFFGGIYLIWFISYDFGFIFIQYCQCANKRKII